MFNKKRKQIIALQGVVQFQQKDIEELRQQLTEVTAERDYYKSRHIDTVSERLAAVFEGDYAGPDRVGLIELCPECGMDGLYHRFVEPAAHSMEHPEGSEASVLCFFCGYNGGRFTQPHVPELVPAATHDSAKDSPVALSEGTRMHVDRTFEQRIIEDMAQHDDGDA